MDFHGYPLFHRVTIYNLWALHFMLFDCISFEGVCLTTIILTPGACPVLQLMTPDPLHTADLVHPVHPARVID